MEVTEREVFSKVLIAVGQIYSKSVTPMLVKLYWQVLEPYDLPVVVQALEAHVKDPDGGQFMPKPADVIRILTGNSLSQSLQAWSKVEQTIRLVGPYQSIVFDEPIIHQVISEMGGWIKICHTKTKELPFVAKEFQTRFAAYRHKAPNGYPSVLLGLSAHQNGYQGYSTEPPLLIGDKTKAQAVFMGSSQERISFQVNKVVPETTPLIQAPMANQIGKY